MEKSKYGVPEASVYSEIEAKLGKLRILDADYLDTCIQEAYRILVFCPADPTSEEQFATCKFKDEKSNQQATECRKEAEPLWKSGKFEEALSLITRSIAFAKRDCAELASAYSDRSYVLFQLKRYNSCLQDVDRAIEIVACPKELRKILYERREQCLIEQEKIEAPEGDLHLEWRKSCNLSPSNADPPNLSHKLKVRFNEKRERHLIAIEDIQPGEILSVEDFYVTGVNFAKLVSHCSFCLLECDTLIPCFTCTRDMYCSKNCRSKAFSLFHQSECKFMRVYSYSERTLWYKYKTAFVVKTFLIGTKQGKELDNLMKKLKPRDIFVGKYDQYTRFDDYRSILQMRKIDRFRKMDVYTAVGMVIVLIRSSFFGDFNTLPDRLSSVQSYAALLLLNHIRTIEMMHPVVEKIHLRGDSLDSKSAEKTSTAKYFDRQLVGFGICSLQNSLIKRSCFGNTSTFHQNRQRIAFASRTIQSGEKLSLFLFHKPKVCENDACSTHCPDLESLEKEEIPFSSTLDFSFKTKIKALTMRTHAAIERAKKQPPVLSNEEMLNCIIEHCNLLCKMLTIPSYDICACEELLITLMKLLYCKNQRLYRHLSMENFFAGTTDLISKRIYLLYDTKFAPKNRK